MVVIFMLIEVISTVRGCPYLHGHNSFMSESQSVVVVLWVVLYAHNTPSSSSTHAPFLAPSLIFKNLLITLLAASNNIVTK